MLQTLILLIFFVSGITGLVYEIIWSRVFGLIFGNTTLAFSAVLSAFMMGLAAGSLLIGKRTESMKQHLKIYALLEFGIGVCALLIPLFNGPLEQLFSFFWLYTSELPFLFYLLKFIFAFLIMFPATFFMGGTLPVLSHVFIHSPNKIGLDTGKLYGINTLGAMLGAFLTGFVLVRKIGVFPSVYYAVVTNLLLAAAALLLSRFYTDKNASPVKEPVKEIKLPDGKTRLIITAMAISGFTALSYEVLWNHVLVFILTNSVYALSVMLTTVLGGIGFGSYFGGRLADRYKNQMALLGWIEIALGISAFVAALVLMNLSWLHDKIFMINPGTSWWYWNGIRFLEAFLVMFLPAVFMGASFPVASRIVTPRLQKIGARLGLLYFFNTLGGVIGSFLTAFIFISLFGIAATMAAMILLNLLLGVFFLLNNDSIKTLRFAAGYLLLSVMLLLVILKITPARLFAVAYTHVEKDNALVGFREGIEGTVTVHEIKRPFEQNLRIDVDGLNVAGTSFMLKTLQTLQGYLPICIHGNAKSVLQIGFGTGQTSKSVLRQPVDEFHLVEISKDVLDLSDQYFHDINEGVVHHPGFNHFIADGKNYVKYTRQQYDVIMNDANYAVATASASLFTLEHFLNCRKKLKPGGIFSTWMTIDLDPVDFQIVLKTFQSVFPYCTLWMAPNCVNKQIVLIGAEQPWKIDYAKLSEQFADSSIRKDFADININSAFDVLDCFLLDHDGIRQISMDAPVNTDNHPILEFSTRDIRSRDLCSYQNLGKMIHRRPEPINYLINIADNEKQKNEIEQTLKRHYLAAGLLLKGMLENYQGNLYASSHTLIEGSRMIPESNLAKQFFEKIDLVNKQLLVEAGHGSENSNARLNLARYWIGLLKFDEALRTLRSLEKRYPHNIQITFEMARAFQGIARTDSARIYIFKTLQLKPDFAAALYFAGEMEYRQGEYPRALEYLNKALQQDGRMYEAHNTIGRIYMNQRNFSPAARSFARSLDIMEFQPVTMFNLADCYMQLKDMPKAITCYQNAQIMGVKDAELYFNLGNAFYMTQKYTMAEESYLNALALDSTNAEIYYNFGNTLILTQKTDSAIAAYMKAVSLNPNEPDYYNNLAMAYKQSGRMNESLRVFNRALQRFPDSKQLAENYQNTIELMEAK
ncbi:MAG TPA: fused MFS/spermidine synthase [bacterium]|nr:fused MFS/spermidine synthase [bacterium]HPN43579.1 fused MFS/spermidine synthase [bacterium]